MGFFCYVDHNMLCARQVAKLRPAPGEVNASAAVWKRVGRPVLGLSGLRGNPRYRQVGPAAHAGFTGD